VPWKFYRLDKADQTIRWRVILGLYNFFSVSFEFMKTFRCAIRSWLVSALCLRSGEVLILFRHRFVVDPVLYRWTVDTTSAPASVDYWERIFPSNLILKIGQTYVLKSLSPADCVLRKNGKKVMWNSSCSRL